MTARDVLVRQHRYAGLAMAMFLVMSGLTGAIIAFNHELDEWLNPELFHAGSEGTPLPALELAARLARAEPRLAVTYLPLTIEPGHSLSISVGPRIDPATGEAFPLDYNEVFVDPTTGEIQGKRFWGGCCLERENLLPFLYILHYSLHMPGNWGLWLMGGVALVWVFDCFIGLWLTFPRARPFFAKWKRAWQVKGNGNAYRTSFDLHRAGGLWLWGLLLIIAVSGVALNLDEEVFTPVVSVFSPITPTVWDEREEAPPEKPIETSLALADVLSRATAEAARRGWELAPFGIFYSAEFGLFGVGFGEDHAAGLGGPWLYFDGQSGAPVGDYVPGEGTAGDVFSQLQFPLHSGQIAGLAGRIVIAVAGVTVAMLSITGVVIWLRKRASRSTAQARQRATVGAGIGTEHASEAAE
jgi:uncharacterized iron-regulated membrane protein